MLNFVSLLQYPHKFHEYVKLIEECFGYENPYQFQVDFYPLVSPSNFKYCYMYIDNEEKIIATCALKKRWINNSLSSVIYFLGAIAVDVEYQNKGIGKKIVLKTLECCDDGAWFGLWSEKKYFFNPLGFSDYGDQFFLPQCYLINRQSNITLKQYEVSSLSDDQKEFWKQCYLELEKKFMTLKRSEQHWLEIYHITSAKFYEIFYLSKRVGYAIVHKGMDLQNVVHEFFTDTAYELAALEKLNQDFSIWLPIFDYDWNEEFLGKNLMIKPGKEKLWNEWQRQSSEKKLFISGLDSV